MEEGIFISRCGSEIYYEVINKTSCYSSNPLPPSKKDNETKAAKPVKPAKAVKPAKPPTKVLLKAPAKQDS